jgi:hypothetical protein
VDRATAQAALARRRRARTRKAVIPLAAAGALASMAALIPMLMALQSDPTNHRPLLSAAGMLLAGVVGKRWLTLLVVIPAFAITLILFDIAAVQVVGYDRWEELNAWHWGGGGLKPAVELLEHIAFAVLYSAGTVLGMLIRMGFDRLNPSNLAQEF